MPKSTEIQSPVCKILDFAMLSGILTRCDHAIVNSLYSMMNSHPKASLCPINTTSSFPLVRLVVVSSWKIFKTAPLTKPPAFLSNSPFKPPPPLEYCTTYPLQFGVLLNFCPTEAVDDLRRAKIEQNSIAGMTNLIFQCSHASSPIPLSSHHHLLIIFSTPPLQAMGHLGAHTPSNTSFLLLVRLVVVSYRIELAVARRKTP